MATSKAKKSQRFSARAQYDRRTTLLTYTFTVLSLVFFVMAAYAYN